MVVVLSPLGRGGHLLRYPVTCYDMMVLLIVVERVPHLMMHILAEAEGVVLVAASFGL